jgi:hypothetical protein
MYNEVNGRSYSDYPQANQGQAYLIYSIVYFVINFGLFFVLNTGIEVKLVWRMHRELREKRERLAKMNNVAVDRLSSSNFETTSTVKTDKKKKENEDEIKQRRVIKMVVLTSVFNILLRAPDMLSWIENVNIFPIVFGDAQYFLGQFVPGLLSFIADLSYLTYILTFTTNFVIFFKFNKNFKEAVVCSWTATSTKK